MKIPLSPPLITDLVAGVAPLRLLEIMKGGPTPGGDYAHWDKLRHRKPPQGYSIEEWWAGMKLARIALYRPLPFQDKTNRSFRYALPDLVLKMLHEIDRDLVSRLRGSEQIANPHTRDTYAINALIEEAITSSQLEGASTTRGVAKHMLREGRMPRTVSEQMIANNYQAMHFLRERAKEPMTPALIIEIHAILMMGTLDDSAPPRRLRCHEDDIHVVDNRDGRVIHIPPAAEKLPERMERFCCFANSGDPEHFLHPVIQAIVLHFILAYDHPFTDGNGRTARAVFYWSLLHNDYWLADYISISRILKSAPPSTRAPISTWRQTTRT